MLIPYFLSFSHKNRPYSCYIQVGLVIEQSLKVMRLNNNLSNTVYDLNLAACILFYFL